MPSGCFNVVRCRVVRTGRCQISLAGDQIFPHDQLRCIRSAITLAVAFPCAYRVAMPPWRGMLRSLARVRQPPTAGSRRRQLAPRRKSGSGLSSLTCRSGLAVRVCVHVFVLPMVQTHITTTSMYTTFVSISRPRRHPRVKRVPPNAPRKAAQDTGVYNTKRRLRYDKPLKAVLRVQSMVGEGVQARVCMSRNRKRH